MSYNGDDDKCGGCGSDPCTHSTPQCGFRIRGAFRRLGLVASLLTAVLALAACGSSDAQTVSDNLAKESDQFKVVRKIVISNLYDTNPETQVIWEATGACAAELGRANILELTCRDGENDYKRHLFGIGPNTSWTVAQLDGVDVSRYQTTIVFRPQSLIPNIDIAAGEQ